MTEIHPEALEKAAMAVPGLLGEGKSNWSALPDTAKGAYCNAARKIITAYLTARREAGWVEVERGPIMRHKKRGSEYEVLGLAHLQTDESLEDMARVVVYRGKDGALWARRESEFHDGRFIAASLRTMKEE